MVAQQIDRGQGFERRHVAGAGHYHIGLGAAVVAGPFPESASALSRPSRPNCRECLAGHYWRYAEPGRTSRSARRRHGFRS
jgi:hypothetical protein